VVSAISASPGSGVLDGVRVLDLTRFVAGPYVTMALASLGADVVKLEAPPLGDPYRGQGTAMVGGESSLFLALNGGKRSLALDLRRPEARPLVERLVDWADVVVQNSRPGSLDAYGLGWTEVHERNPACIYGAISAYGPAGPDADRGGFDLVLQAEGGLMSVTGVPDGPPVAVGAPLLDIGAAVSCLSGILAAYVRRLRTGAGSLVTASLYEFSLAGLTTVAAATLVTGEEPGRNGGHSPMFAPYGAFRAADDFVVLAGAGSEHLWVRLCDVLGCPELVLDPRFATNADRVANRSTLVDALEARLASGTVGDWLVRLTDAGVPASRLRSLADVLASEQTEALGTITAHQRPDLGSYRSIGLPFRIGADVLAPSRPAPRLGEHTTAVLDELGIAATARDALVEAGVTA
jgi:crotonobetainyl-CoA:carnitine CoA-transferase CaiB-like acyl-CoA transferase